MAASVPWKPNSENDFPTLGYDILDWMMENLAQPGKLDYQPYIPTQEQAEFIIRYYEIDPKTNARKITRGVISRPRGWGKSPFLGAIAAAEALADVVFDGWDANGQPVGKPWSEVMTPLIQVVAVSEKQTKNAWTPLLQMLENGPAVDNYPGLEPMSSFINLPVGIIEPFTASANSIKGAPCSFAVMDQTEEWTKSNGGVNLAETMRGNASKCNGTLIESPNAYIPGNGSVAENSANFYKLMIDGKARDDSLLYDHREADPATDLDDYESLFDGIAFAYGDSADLDECRIHNPPCDRRGWVNVDRQVKRFWMPDTDIQVARSDLLNQVTYSSDAFVSQPEWERIKNADAEVEPGETVTLGFDGSRKRQRGVTDSTALIGCRVSDGHLFHIASWEQPDKAKDWQVPTVEVDAAVREAFDKYNVVGFYADPAKWETWVASWEADFGKELIVGRRDHPIEWWMTGGRTTIIERAIEQFYSAIAEEELTHDGSYILTRHALNARRRFVNGHLKLDKEHKDSHRKIDAIIAAMLAYTAYLDAVAKGVNNQSTKYVPKRIR